MLNTTAGTPLEILQTVYGFPAFRGEQQAVIDAAMAGKDALVLMPTGGGKSVCYQLPALLRAGLGIVVSPLIALMQDQVRALRQLGIDAAFLNSTLSLQEQDDVLRRINDGSLDLLYVAPERLLQEATLDYLARQRISLIAIDEAHCVSSWGHDFRQDYLSLDRLRERFPKVPRMALTATADERTREDIVQRLALTEPRRFIAGFDRPNIRYTVLGKKTVKTQLLNFLDSHKGEAGIVYCLSRRSVEDMAKHLCSHGYDAVPYHAGLPPETRARHQERFLREEAVIVVATIAFGMGIDKPDVRFVAHVDLPKSMESYYQETGRAGRDGEPAEAWMAYGLQDVVRLSQMADQSEADENHKRLEREKLNALLGWCEVARCRRRALLAYFGEDYPRDCGNCDVCQVPPGTWDGTVAAQMVLSCVYRTEQRFGAVHIIDVLRGSDTAKVQQHRHNQVSTFGIGTERSVNQWRSVIRQLIAQGYLYPDHARYGALRLTASSRGLLRGEVTLELREDVEKARAPRKRKDTSYRKERDLKERDLKESDLPLWEALRAHRKEVADEQGVPPYVVFHDSTLKAMARERPATLDDMLSIPGIGQAKLQRYGESFLDVICLGA